MQQKNLSKSSNDEQNQYLTAFRNLEHKLENMFNHFWHNPFGNHKDMTDSFSFELEGTPKVDIIDRDKELVVKAELPGINKKDLDVSITHNHLLIKAKTCVEEKQEEDNYLRRETTSREYYRSLHLPANVDADKVSSKFENGLLELTLPKQEDSFRKKIDIE